MPLLGCIHLALHLLNLLTQHLHLHLHKERLSINLQSIHFPKKFASPEVQELHLQRLHLPVHTHTLRVH